MVSHPRETQTPLSLCATASVCCPSARLEHTSWNWKWSSIWHSSPSYLFCDTTKCWSVRTASWQADSRVTQGWMSPHHLARKLYHDCTTVQKTLDKPRTDVPNLGKVWQGTCVLQMDHYVTVFIPKTWTPGPYHDIPLYKECLILMAPRNLQCIFPKALAEDIAPPNSMCVAESPNTFPVSPQVQFLMTSPCPVD